MPWLALTLMLANMLLGPRGGRGVLRVFGVCVQQGAVSERNI